MTLPNLRDYFLPDSRPAAIELMARFGERAMVVAGGTFVHGLEARGLMDDVVALIDIRHLGLRGVERRRDGTVALGALATLADLDDADFVRNDPAFGAIRDALTYPPPQIRNVGTVGGCVAAAAPFYDVPAALLALDGRVLAASGTGEREIPLADFFVALFANVLEPDELITGLLLPAPAPRTASAFLKLEANANDLAILNVAVRLTLDGRGKCLGSRIILGGGVGETYVRAAASEAALNGKVAGAASFAAASAVVAQDIEFVSDHRGSAAYRRCIAQVHVRRALTTAMERLG